MDIVIIDQDPKGYLSKKAEKIQITEKGLSDAKQIAENLIKTLIPLMPAAGLAAPQIGISKQIFIYSWNRTEENIEVVINPSFEPMDEEANPGWEACFSTLPDKGPCRAALVKRYKKILATFTDLNGQTRKKIMEGYAARVFQHEYDHLQGIVNVRRNDIETKKFAIKEEAIAFMKKVRQKESLNYIQPKEYCEPKSVL